MASVGTPAETRAYILERLVGETGEPDRVTTAARSAGERVAATVARRLTEVLALGLDIEVKRVDLIRTVEARPKPATHSAVVVAASPGSPDALMLIMDGDAIALAVSTVFGGDPDIAVNGLERDPSPLELEIAASVFAEVAEAFSGTGQRSLGLMLPAPAPVSGPELKKLVIRDAPAVRIVLGVSTRAGSGEIAAIIPQRIFLKHRGDAAADGEAGAGAWGVRFGEEVMRSSVEVVATMPVARLTLGELSVLAVGQVVAFDDGAQANVRLAARGKPLFTCEFGRLGQNYTVRVREPFDTGQDLIDGLLPANRI